MNKSRKICSKPDLCQNNWDWPKVVYNTLFPALDKIITKCYNIIDDHSLRLGSLQFHMVCISSHFIWFNFYLVVIWKGWGQFSTVLALPTQRIVIQLNWTVNKIPSGYRCVSRNSVPWLHRRRSRTEGITPQGKGIILEQEPDWQVHWNGLRGCFCGKEGWDFCKSDSVCSEIHKCDSASSRLTAGRGFLSPDQDRQYRFYARTAGLFFKQEPK